MHYEINVSLNGKHFFATAERSATTYEKAKEIYKTLKEKFPEKDGFRVDCTEWNTVGKRMFP